MALNSSHSAPDQRQKRGFFTNVAALVLARGFLALSQVLVLPIIARFLTVEEFAIMALAMTVVIFASVLSDGGLGRSLIRTSHYDPVEWSSVFWLLTGLGLGLCAGVLLMAPIWAWYFAEPMLLPIISTLSVLPLMQSISATPNAEIERREHYTALARLQIVAAGTGLLVAVLLALVGAGVWALVGQQVVLAAVRLVGVLYLSAFRPSLSFSRLLLSGHLGFARDTIVTSIISVVQHQSAFVAIGKLLGSFQLGLFAMNQRFSRLPQFGLAGPFSSVVYVRMAKAKESPEMIAAIYLAASRLLAAVLIPAMAMIAVSGRDLFGVLLSDKWSHVAPIFALSMPGIVAEAVTITCLVCIFRALGRTDLQVRLVIEGTVLKVVLVVISASVSLEAVACVFTLWALIYIPRGWMLARQVVPISIRACAEVLLRPIAVSVVAVATYVFVHPWHSLAPSSRIVEAMVLALLAYGLLVMLDRQRLRVAVDLFTLR